MQGRVFEKIVKRDGRIQDFDSSKICQAITKAGQATGEFGKDVAQRLTIRVLNLATQLIKDRYPTVEEIQDIVEEVLINSPYKKTAKAYIIYRDQHAKIREIASKFNVDLVDAYLNRIDWQVRENSNMNFSLQGLNNYISSQISKIYWLNKIYPPEIRNAHNEGDFHIHDLGILSVYCVGWDLQDLLYEGFKGAASKIESKPAKHFHSILGQVVNFFYTLQGEAAGAQAFSNFDTLLCPFIYYDKLSYKDVKQALQEFLFNVNVPTRVGFQCVSEDTEILTESGWKSYQEVNEGDKIFTFNIKNKKIELNKVVSVFRRKYKGIMYHLKNRIQNQLISPGHRVVRRKFNTDNYVLEPIEEVLKLKSPFVVPIAGINPKKDISVEDEQIKLMAWIISEGSIERKGKFRSCYRISIYQSKEKNPANYKEIKNLLDHFKFNYSEYEHKSLGSPVVKFRLDAQSSKIIHKWFGTKEDIHFIPEWLFNLSRRQTRLFLETYLKADGFDDCKIAISDIALLNDLQRMVINAEWAFTVLKRKPTIGKKDIYVLRIIKHAETYINKVEKVEYEGVIWCPHTKNETIIARRNGKVFITGNTPFTNITLDLIIPSYYADQGVIIGGKIQDKTYKEFRREQDMFNKAFLEVMLEGDAKGRPFTFPIPTYNITRDFDWDNGNLNLLWETTARYGIPYFANFVNSDMKPEEARSMCCRLRIDNRKLEKRGGGLFGSSPLTGSIGVVTINIPRIGYLSKTESKFFQRLNYLMELAKESLEIKRKVLEILTERDLYPYAKFYLRNIKKRFGQYWTNHFSTIGVVGMNEVCLNFLKKDLGSKEAIKFTLKVLDFMREKLLEFQKGTGNNYNLEATPAESTSYRLAKLDKEKYPDIICANEPEFKKGAQPFYTNSTQLPVNFTDDVFEALELQDEIQTKYTGGTVLHIFVGEKTENPQIVKKLVKNICNNYRLPYFTITPTFSICPQDGYMNGEYKTCPKCGRECEVYSRVVGYLRPVSSWNNGKQEEFKLRKTFKVR
ncbi:MAG: ribonucleoside triphosphate reductase [Candidatus Omnitrophota bacterium]|nr:MAG: ribonucleoside triphosphate reductase [Candidatus Omnitrophota bacterium]